MPLMARATKSSGGLGLYRGRSVEEARPSVACWKGLQD